MEVSREKKLELINKISFFAGFDDMDKDTMADLANFKQFLPEENIIAQHSNNTELFFIINGTVDIVIDGKIVVSLAGGGHVFGEMSFVHHNPASASVVANTKVTAMVFDTEKINQMVEPIYYKLRMDIYRSCAEILAKRLIQTNTIATEHLFSDQ